jgi:hypothetical protein
MYANGPVAIQKAGKCVDLSGHGLTSTKARR